MPTNSVNVRFHCTIMPTNQSIECFHGAGKTGDIKYHKMVESMDIGDSSLAAIRGDLKPMRGMRADGDGKISREEWIAKYGSAEGFDQYDLGATASQGCHAALNFVICVDGDGIIDANEFRLIHAATIDFTRLDKDGTYSYGYSQLWLLRDCWLHLVFSAVLSVCSVCAPCALTSVLTLHCYRR